MPVRTSCDVVVVVVTGIKLGDMVSQILEEDEFGNSFSKAAVAAAALKSNLHPGATPFTMDRSPASATQKSSSQQQQRSGFNFHG